MTHQDFQQFLNALAPILDFQELHPDQEGACLIHMKQSDLHLLFEYDDDLVPQTILLSCALAPLPKKQEVLTALLEGGALLSDTLSIKPGEKLIYLHRRLLPFVEKKELQALIENFEKSALFWKKRLADFSKNGESAPISLFPYKA